MEIRVELKTFHPAKNSGLPPYQDLIINMAETYLHLYEEKHFKDGPEEALGRVAQLLEEGAAIEIISFRYDELYNCSFIKYEGQDRQTFSLQLNHTPRTKNETPIH